MITFQQVENVYDSKFEENYALYTEAFPNYSRRKWANIETLFTKKQNFNCINIYKDNEFVGLFHYWDFEQFVFVEHFAILPHLQGHGLGTESMKLFMSQHQVPIILETETPRTTIASKRIFFYERLGFLASSNFYMQPPYEGGQVMISMLIMSNNYQYVTKHFGKIKNTIYKEVYKYDPKKN